MAATRDRELLGLAGLAVAGFVAIGASLPDPVAGSLVGALVLAWPVAHVAAARPTDYSRLAWWGRSTGFVVAAVLASQLAGVLWGR